MHESELASLQFQHLAVGCVSVAFHVRPVAHAWIRIRLPGAEVDTPVCGKILQSVPCRNKNSGYHLQEEFLKITASCSGSVVDRVDTISSRSFLARIL